MGVFHKYRFPIIDQGKIANPHVVIIGAGASRAACSVDRNGKVVPLLRDIHHVLNITSQLEKYSLTGKEWNNFESLYSYIFDKKEYKKLKDLLERSIEDYFSSLQLPESVTIYDYLVLALTKKDIIISFNWDPFLLQAYRRNLKVGNLPQIVFLHGNVGLGVCYKCKNKGYINDTCPSCHQKLERCPLLYPVCRKNYYEDPLIKNEWSQAKDWLSNAGGITIFGYSAPETDREAYHLLKNSYQKSKREAIAPFTLIDLQEKQMKKWQDIFDERMAVFCTRFEQTNLWKFPRESLEAMWKAILLMKPRLEKHKFKCFESLTDLQCFVKSFTENDYLI